MKPTERDERREGAPDERGSALVLVLIMIVMLSGATILLAQSAQTQRIAAQASSDRELQLLLADIGLGKGLGSLLAMDPGERDALSTDWEDAIGAGPSGVMWDEFDPSDSAHRANLDAGAWVQWRREGSGFFRLRAYGVQSDGARQLELLASVSEPPVRPMRGYGTGAIVGLGSFKTNGALTVDGRDHRPDGTLRTDSEAQHVPGFTITGTLNQGGASKVGGGTQAPSKNPSEGNGVDSSSSAVYVTEDEDGGTQQHASFPKAAGQLFGQENNLALKQHAIGAGTFFTLNGGTLEQYGPSGFTGVTYDAWLNTADAKDGGDIIYIEGPDNTDFGQIDLPDNGGSAASPSKPSILFIQNSEWTASNWEDHLTCGFNDHNTKAGPIHVKGTFKGVLVGDEITKMNGNGRLIGAVFAYNNEGTTISHIGNGTFDVLFSSEVLGDLPGPSQNAVPPIPRVTFWRELKPGDAIGLPVSGAN